MSEFFAMGGYGFYIWTSYAVAAVVMVALVVASLRTLRRNEAQLRALQDAVPGGRRRRREARDEA